MYTSLNVKMLMNGALALLLAATSCKAPQQQETAPVAQSAAAKPEAAQTPIITGADQTEAYLPYLKGKRVGMVVNPTSIIGNKLSVDSLHALGVNIVKVFGPEHGFRGDAPAGIKVEDSVDPKTGIKVVSLYGKRNKPTKEDLADVDLMIFDIQDVGTRFYTYTITLHRVMEACAENGVELMVLDRPNPNGFLVDGPILEPENKSGIGIHPIPIAHGLTVGEFAQMINGEKWLANGVQCKLKIVPVKNYNHDMAYDLPVWPSPNLNSQQAILLYPSTCLFEGTIFNHGRGTMFPFTVMGHPDMKDKYAFSYTPTGIKGMAETPLHQDKVCYGLDLRNYDVSTFRKTGRINLSWMIELYQAYPDKERFFDYKQSNQIGNIDKLAGTKKFKEQIIAGVSEEEIRQSWEPGLSQYKQMRQNYLLYP
ncbi:exo-beta-N-acetylmuramidase NamZ domain-containing protein [Pontibacter sp. HSC-36F09]|uniref:exo-beta-N-acetylmuramidase NamZ family protein n=1 Tax=Pontibacter sp. HSC-36F09 TaxID=2910966 RepID=UPI0020A138FF|nr:DUF1343 domain-containing protein [Pontibacter sp. HSC-36F09]MCP2043381.1 uncharacterized protein YbbC (DUF1343 family) [Pontibacter sp. HSC-36F09]